MIKGIDCFKKFGLNSDKIEKDFMMLWDVPPEIEIGVLPNRLYTNKIMIEPLTAVFKDLIKSGAVAALTTFDGCYNPRPIRGYEKDFNRFYEKGDFINASKFASLHYWGLATDWDAAWNQIGKQPKIHPLVIKAFKDNGFDWGGDFSRVDGMHFQISSL